jgi:arylsulfatase A
MTPLFAAALAAAVSAAPPAAAPSRPNVILIMADDLGYETLGCNGGTSYKTPVLDALAAGGVRFTRCNVQPLCTPTRMQLMTGRYNVRNYVDFGRMDPSLKTFGNLFRDAGYVTGIVGKWQLGHDVDLPRKFGFDDACLWQHTRRPGRYRNPGLEINGKEVDYTNGEYGPELVNNHALDFIERNKARPFFLYYPMILTHDPFDATPDSPDYGAPAEKKKAAGGGGGAGHFGDMVAYMDKMIGRLVAKLDKLGLRENTVIVFLGDNGTGKGVKSMMGGATVIGGKGATTAAGTHVPLIVSWPGKASAGKVCDDLVDSTDFLPTICEAAGISVPADWAPDGRSFLPQVRGEKGDPRQWWYCWYAPRGTMVGEFAATANHKLYRDGRFYDLTTDPGETKPLAVASLSGEAAAAAEKLRAALDRYKDARPAHLPKPKPAGKKAAAGE